MVNASTSRLAQPLLALLLASVTWADDRLGSYSSSIPFIRGVAANVVGANIGEPEQQLQLALSELNCSQRKLTPATGADYFMVANSSCTSCIKDAAG